MNNSRIAVVLWLLSIIAFMVVTAQREVQLGTFIFGTIVYALLMGLYLMFSDVRIAEALPQFTRNGGEYGLPGFLFLLFVILVLIARITNPVIAIVVAGATLWVPVGLWSRNEEALTPIQAVAGLAVLLIPLGADVVFGASHLNNPPNVCYYFILATIAGFFYGRTFLRTGKVAPAAIAHLSVDWMWSIFFAG